jgi:hypothetical protein
VRNALKECGERSSDSSEASSAFSFSFN